MRVILLVLSSAAMLVALSACDSSKPQPAAPAPAASVAPPATSSPPAPAPRDLAQLQACAIVPAEEIAGLVGGKVLAPPSGTGPGCLYAIEDSGGETGLYKLIFQEAAVIEAMVKASSPAELGEQVVGPWDEAWLGPQAMAEGFRILALVRGDLAVEVGGPRREVLAEIAARAVNRTR